MSLETIKSLKQAQQQAQQQALSRRWDPIRSRKVTFREEKNATRSKLALLAKDFVKLTDDELLLLPLKDFWDSRKKQWKKNAAGGFAKQNSSRIKNLFGKSKFNQYTRLHTNTLPPTIHCFLNQIIHCLLNQIIHCFLT